MDEHKAADQGADGAGKDAACPARRRSPVQATGSALLTDEQAAREIFAVSPRTFADVMKQAWMPQPIILGPRMRRWSRAELEAAIASAPRQTAMASEPERLRRGKIDAMKARGVAR